MLNEYKYLIIIASSTTSVCMHAERGLQYLSCTWNLAIQGNVNNKPNIYICFLAVVCFDVSNTLNK